MAGTELGKFVAPIAASAGFYWQVTLLLRPFLLSVGHGLVTADIICRSDGMNVISLVGWVDRFLFNYEESPRRD